MMFGRSKGIDATTAFERRDDLVFIDVREPHEWSAGHIDGAVHIPMRELPTRLGEIGTERPLAAVCRSGQRSGRVTAFLRDNGFHVENLEGGLKAWTRAGLPLRRPDGRPGRVV